MIGHMYASDFTTKENHPVTVVATIDGLIAVLPFGELKGELRRAPDAVFKVFQIACKYSMETFYYNLNGVEHNPFIKHPPTAQMSKKLRDFYFKNNQMRAFLKGVEKRDEKFIIQALKGTEVEAAERVIKKGTWDRCMLVVADGELIAFRDDGENDVYTEGAILGIEQFLFNKKWDVDIICGKTAIVTKLTWETLMDLVPSQALTASRLYKRIMRHYCYMQLYDSGKKAQN